MAVGKAICASLAVNVGQLILAASNELDAEAQLAVDDECGSTEECSANLVQLRAHKAQEEAKESMGAGAISSSKDSETWPWNWWPSSSDSALPFKQWGSGGNGGGSWQPGGAPSPGGRSSGGAPAPVPPAEQCAPLNEKSNRECKSVIEWVMKGGRYDKHASTWFKQMPLITGMDYTNATEDDFHRLYFCSPPGGKACGRPPCQCSVPPCSSCFGGAPPRPRRPGCNEWSTTVDCKAPAQPLDYKGVTWPTMTFRGGLPMHIFAIGDWGGMDGTLNPIESRPPLIAYAGGNKDGPSVFPRTRWNSAHTIELCNHKQFVECYASDGKICPVTCGFVKGVDDQPQLLVAQAMKDRARTSNPQYILNVGDNFYWGGIEKNCGTPMDQMSFTAHHQFDQVFEKVYTGPGLDGKPWLSVLGNHDWGGRVFNNGWDQQIAYTWHSNRWVMPAPYYMVHVEYPDQLFSIDIVLIDTNVMDAHEPHQDPDHNICGPNNPVDADCGPVGGPSSKEHCARFFKDLWHEEKTWVEDKLNASTATWQILVTHFPCGQDAANQGWYRSLRKKYGLDLLVTGHRHEQELWLPTEGRNWMGGLTCFVTGGGGGISSEATPNPHDKRDWYGEGQYGFYDITVSKFSMNVESINYDGQVLKSAMVYPYSP